MFLRNFPKKNKKNKINNKVTVRLQEGKKNNKIFKVIFRNGEKKTELKIEISLPIINS